MAENKPQDLLDMILKWTLDFLQEQAKSTYPDAYGIKRQDGSILVLSHRPAEGTPDPTPTAFASTKEIN